MGDITSLAGRERLALDLELTVGSIESWLNAWAEFPGRLRLVEDYLLNSGLSADERQRERSRDVLNVVAPLRSKADASGLQQSDLPEFAAQLAVEIKKEKESHNYRAAGSLYSVLHGQLENLVNLLLFGLSDIEGRAARCIGEVGQIAGNELEKCGGILDQILAAARSQSPELLKESLEALNTLRPEFPVPAHRRWIIVAVEDDPVWQQVIKRTLNFVRDCLETDYEVAWELYPDKLSGEARIRELSSRFQADRALEGAAQRPLAILDMGIPKSRADEQGPSRDEGLDLLRLVRSHTVNVPAIVLTTAPNFLGDHLTASGLGVSDYLLKDSDSEEYLLNVLLRIITRRSRRRMKVFEETGRLLTIDDVQVTLEPAVFRTVSVLVDRAPRGLTVSSIVDLLQDKYGGYKSLATPSEGLTAHFINVSTFWQKATAPTRDASEAMNWLRREKYDLWQAVAAELNSAGVPTGDAGAISIYMESHYPQTFKLGEDFDPKNIEKHVSQARKAIKAAFNSVGKNIFPEEEVLVNSLVDEEFAYKVVAEVQEGSGGRPDVPNEFRVLVAENDIQGWREPIERLLRQYGYKVVGTGSESEAVDLARGFRPNLLCLDMHMPADNPSFQADPMGGDAESGLRVLRAVSGFLPDVRAVVMTDLADQDYIRSRAVEMGVRVSDFMAKRVDPNSPWEAELLSKVYRVEGELRRQSVLPLPNFDRLPYVHLWRSRKDEMYVEVFDRQSQLGKNRFALLWLLAGREGRPVPTSEVLFEIYGDEPGREGKLIQLVKNFRRQIAKEWLGITDPQEAKRAAEAVLANDAKAGYVLNARVVIDD
jgi:CheY-like chemotaxis protein